MPVILEPKNYAAWLGEDSATAEALKALLKPYQANRMEALKIGPRIGNVRYDDAKLVDPI